MFLPASCRFLSFIQNVMGCVSRRFSRAESTIPVDHTFFTIFQIILSASPNLFNISLAPTDLEFSCSSFHFPKEFSNGSADWSAYDLSFSHAEAVIILK
ncbi:hypothetical protein Trydic_g21666 [Trypoxylus dichotomus]